jgi:hypothetical protein
MSTYDRRLDKPIHGQHPWVKSANQLDIPWWESMRMPSLGSTQFSTNPEAILGYSLLKKAVSGGPMVQSASWYGNLIVHPKKLLEACNSAIKLRCVYASGSEDIHLLSSEDTMLRVIFYARQKIAEILIISSNPTKIVYAHQLFGKLLVPDDPKKGTVFTLAKTLHGYNISRLGLAGTPIERLNYSRQVLAAYDHIVEDLNSDEPCGRLVILAGEPGTGKTYLVRSLLSEVPKASFIVVPPHLVEELGSPDILPSLTAAKDEIEGPMILILEDADQCLVPRQQASNKNGNMNSISSLLNLGDGILGSVLDLRIIATTNAEAIEMDPAIRRPGRLCTYSHVGPLSSSEAAQVLSRLLGKKIAEGTKENTLAEIYLKARKLGWKPPTKTATQKQLENLRRDII